MRWSPANPPRSSSKKRSAGMTCGGGWMMASLSPPETADGHQSSGGAPLLRGATADAAIELIHRLVAIESLSGGEREAVVELCRQMDARSFRTEIDAAGN